MTVALSPILRVLLGESNCGPRGDASVVRADTLRDAQARPEEHHDLIVRVAGYSDYFCDLPPSLQEEIIARTEHEGL
jgi:pyruvate-formate lyase